jgi:hypothetical protein
LDLSGFEVFSRPWYILYYIWTFLLVFMWWFIHMFFSFLKNHNCCVVGNLFKKHD